MVSPIRVVSRPWRGFSERHTISKEISRLNRRNGLEAKPLTTTLEAVLKKSMSLEEEAWISRIERLRCELVDASAEITMMDFGAGSPDLDLRPEEMSRGRVVRKTIGEICQGASQQERWAFLLFKLVRELRPSVCLELGTALGISTAYQAAALALNRHGKIVTLEGAETLASLARDNLRKLGLSNVLIKVGRFQETLSEVLAENDRIDFAFIDGHHDERATEGYFQRILPFVPDGGIVVLDDVDWSGGMRKAWRRIAGDARLKLHLDLGKFGVCVVGSTSPRQHQSTVFVA